MGRLSKQLVGTQTGSTGVVQMAPDPDFTNGRSTDGPIHTLPYLSKSAVINLTIGGTDTPTLAVEGNNGDPNVAGDWVSIQDFTADGVWTNKDVWSFIRFNLTGTIADPTTGVTVKAAFESS